MTTGTITAAQLISDVATGTAPLVVASTTLVANLNVATLGGATFAAPGPIGSGTPGSGAFTTLSATGALTYGGVALSAAVTGTGNMVLSASPTLTGTLTAAIANFSGLVTASNGLTSTAGTTTLGTVNAGAITGTGNVSFSTGGTSPNTTIGTNLGGDNSWLLNMLSSSVVKNWQMSFNSFSNGLSFTASTAGGGSTFPSSALLNITDAGAVTIPGTLASGALTVTGAISATTTIKTGGYTIGTLPTPATGMRTYVTDAEAPTFLATLVTGAGTDVTCPAFYDGAAWKAC